MTNVFPLGESAQMRGAVLARRPSGNGRDLLDGTDAVIYALARSVEERDSSLGSHCERLAVMSSIMGLMLKLPHSDIVALNHGGYLHDIGKCNLPDSILLKAGPLTFEEWKLMKEHPARGEEICRDVPALRAVLPIIRHHHERWDGSGYPDGLRGEQIPLLARILQMADIYDALTSERPYKQACPPAQAIAILEEESARGWRDPAMMAVLKTASPFFESDDFWQLSGLSLAALAGAVQGHTVPRTIARS